MTRLRGRAFAKLNLGLKILGLRPDGYHDLRTVFQTVALADAIAIVHGPGTGIRLTVQHDASSDGAPADVPEGEENLVFKAAQLAREAFGIRGQLRITLKKRIPTQAGLGGGSSDAACVLMLLQTLARTRIPAAQLWRLAASLGSDVPGFLVGGTVLGLGRGDETYPLPDVPAWRCVIAMPRKKISTADAYRLWDERYAAAANELTDIEGSAKIYEFCSFVREALPASLERDRGTSTQKGTGVPKVRAGFENDFEDIVFSFSPDFPRIRKALVRAGAVYFGLTGSGAAQFGLFHDRRSAQRAAARLEQFGPVWNTRLLPRAQYKRLRQGAFR